MTSSTLAAYKTFLVVTFPAGSYDVNDPVIAMSYNVAVTLVNDWLMNVSSPDPTLPTLYALAVYNLATDRFVNFATAQAAPPGPVYPKTALPYLDGLRGALNINGFVGGVITGASDNGTSQSMVTPEIMSHLTFDDLQTLKTKWGRIYMGIAQMFGHSDWGIS